MPSRQVRRAQERKLLKQATATPAQLARERMRLLRLRKKGQPK